MGSLNCGVYKIENLISGKIYIGGSLDFKMRQYNHFNELKHSHHSNPNLQKDYDQYKEENFKFIVLLYCEPFELKRYEQFFVDKYRGSGLLHNVCLDDVNSSLGVKCSDEKRAKISKNHADVSGKNNPMWGKHHKEETIKKMSKSKKGLPISEEHRKNISLAKKGVIFTKKHKIGLSIASKRRWNYRPLIFDCFLFFQELDLLEIRLNELYDVVDYFVLHESTKTHSGLDKPLYYEENKDRFKKFHKKIIHKIIADTPLSYIELNELSEKDDGYNMVIQKLNAHTHWPKNQASYGNDSFEKESLIRSLVYCQPQDIILLSDLDEIPNVKTLINLINNFDNNQIYHFQQKMFYYYLNLRKNEPWFGTMALSYEKFLQNSFCEMRQNKQGIFIKDGGWHFSYQGSVDTIKNKIESFGEQSLNLEWVKAGLDNNIANAIKNGRDLYNRPCKFWIEPITYATHPKYLVDNQEEFKDFIYKED